MAGLPKREGFYLKLKAIKSLPVRCLNSYLEQKAMQDKLDGAGYGNVKQWRSGNMS
jgi:hypothetical protein